MNKNMEKLDGNEDDDEFFLKPLKTKNRTLTTNIPPINSISESNISTLSDENMPIIGSKTNNIKIKNITENKIELGKNKHKNKKKIIHSYLKIDKSNKFSILTEEDKKSIEKILLSFRETKEKINQINSVFTPFLERISPNCLGDPITISKSLSQEIFKVKRITKNMVEEYLNYFFSLRYELLYSTHFFLGVKAIKYLGYILSYTFHKFNKYSIKDGKHFNYLLRKTLENREDALIDYYNSLNDIEEAEKSEENKKMDYWKQNRNKYLVPPEINFLVNRFVKIITCEIELDLQGTPVNFNDFNIISLFLLNINRLFVNLKYLKINFINHKFQYELYTSYFQDLLNTTQINKNIIKKNIIINPESIYDRKWNFSDKFNVKEIQVIRQKKRKKEFNKQNLIFDEYNLLYINCSKKEINEEQMLNSTIQKTKEVENENKLNKGNNYNIMNNRDNNYTKKFEKNKININSITQGKKNYIDIIKNNENLLNLIVMMICSIGRLSNINGLDIIMNDSYNNEFLTNLVNLYNINENLIDVDFHILDLIYNKLKDLQQLNIEINSLDTLTFNKVQNIIFKNKNLKSLNISFFSSDITYFRRALLKLYNQTVGGLEKIIKYNDEKLEEIILVSLLPFFTENLSVLFSILKKLESIENLGFNFDLPLVLLNQQNYKIPIIKFILNILFLIDETKCKINNLTIIAPSIIFDGRLLSCTKGIFSQIKINNGENKLKELSLQLQFYYFIDIKNLISTKLIILNLGDLDLFTFKCLVKYLTSYNFSSKSKLEALTIRLNNSLTYFTTELKLLFRKLFYTKISKLSEINIYTNFVIKNKINYLYLIDILKDNWVSDYTITFNSKSDEIIRKNKNLVKNIFCFVPNDEAEVFWYLKYMFNNKYINPLMNFVVVKSCINCILKYLYIKKEIKINHSFENKLNNEKNT